MKKIRVSLKPFVSKLSLFWHYTGMARFKLYFMHKEHSMKIFAVDSNLFNLMILKQQLRNLQYTDITLFDNTEQCLGQLIENPVVVIVHCRSRPDSGIELLQKLKKSNPGIYVVFIASITDMQIAIQSLKHGAFDYILKGTTAINRLEKILEKIQTTEAFIMDNKYDNLSRILF
jgi:DNA-binding NtrC family response regulator